MILLVEDDATMRSHLRDGLELANYEVLEADTAERGLALLAKHKGDVQLVILDLVMPGIGGKGFLEQYQDISPTTRVVIFTGYPSLDTAVPALEGGSDAKALSYWKKPMPMDVLVGKLDSILTEITVDEFQINLRTGEAFCNEIPFTITEIERRLLEAFMRNPRRTWTYEQLANVVRDAPMDPQEAKISLKSQMSRLRRKLSDAAERSVISKHQPGLGFHWIQKRR